MWTRAPLHTAKHLLPLFIKSHVRLSEPVQFKDVSLITLFKGKGDSQDLSNHRAICLLETPGKMLRKQLRSSRWGYAPGRHSRQPSAGWAAHCANLSSHCTGKATAARCLFLGHLLCLLSCDPYGFRRVGGVRLCTPCCPTPASGPPRLPAGSRSLGQRHLSPRRYQPACTRFHPADPS